MLTEDGFGSVGSEEFPYAIGRQAGPRADRSRTCGVADESDGEFVSAKVRAVTVVGYAHFG